METSFKEIISFKSIPLWYVKTLFPHYVISFELVQFL